MELHEELRIPPDLKFKGLTATVINRNWPIFMYSAVSLMNSIVMTSQDLKSPNRAQLFRLPKLLTFHARFSASWIFCRRKTAEIYNIDKTESLRSAPIPLNLVTNSYSCKSSDGHPKEEANAQVGTLGEKIQAWD